MENYLQVDEEEVKEMPPSRFRALKYNFLGKLPLRDFPEYNPPENF